MLKLSKKIILQIVVSIVLSVVIAGGILRFTLPHYRLLESARIDAPSNQWFILPISLDQNAWLQIKISQKTESRYSIFLITESQKEQLLEITASGSNDIEQIPSIIRLENISDNLNMKDVSISKGQYYLIIKNLGGVATLGSAKIKALE